MVCYILKDQNPGEYFSPDFVDGFPKESSTVVKNTRKCVTYLKVYYVLKDQNARDYFNFVKMDFQRSLVQCPKTHEGCHFFKGVLCPERSQR